MYCLLNYLFFILSLLDNTDWLAKFKRYRVYVSQEDQHAIRDFGQYDIYDEDELFYYNNWNSEMESPFDSYDDEDIDPNY